MLESLRIQNFKAFKDTGRLDIKPLTIFMGPNSSGKSSILQCLLMVRQTVDSRDVGNPLVVNGAYASMGSYREFIHKHDPQAELSLELGIRPERSIVTTVQPFQVNTHEIRIRSFVVTAEFGHNRKTLQVYPTKVHYRTDPSKIELVKTRTKGNEYSYELIVNGGDSIRYSSGLPGLNKFYETDIPRFLTSKTRGLLRGWVTASNMLPSRFEQEFSKHFYVGPLRESPKRFYPITGETPQDVGTRGEAVMGVLWTARNRGFLLSRLNHWMAKFGIASRVSRSRLASSLSTLEISDPEQGVKVNFADIGFGASQILPIIVEGYFAPIGSTLLLEQPEIHLHPRAQSTLADLLIHIVGDSGRTILVETHSEHLITRLQRRIAEKTLSSDKIALYYCTPSTDGTSVRKVAFGDNGQFVDEGLPDGFFDEGYKETLALYNAIASGKS